MKQLGLSRKKIGKLHKEYYVKRLEKSSDVDAFQKAIMATIKSMMDVMDVNNKQLTEDILELLHKKQIEPTISLNSNRDIRPFVDESENETQYNDYYDRNELR